MRDKLQAFYLEYLTEVKSFSGMAEKHKMSFKKAVQAVDLGMKIHFKRCRPDMTIQYK